MGATQLFDRGTRRKALFRLRHSAVISAIRAFVWRLKGMRIGARCSLHDIHVTWPHVVAIGARCCIEPGVAFKFDGPYQDGAHIVIGEHVFLGYGVEFNIKDRISIGSHSLIASGCRFIDHDHAIDPRFPISTQRGEMAEISVGEDCWIGANLVVLKGVTIGDGAVVGAGAVITKNIPNGEIWLGVPARKVGERAKRDVSDRSVHQEHG
jgi:acetyltransferase-like isoleucine patch superfamily enzyme